MAQATRNTGKRRGRAQTETPESTEAKASEDMTAAQTDGLETETGDEINVSPETASQGKATGSERAESAAAAALAGSAADLASMMTVIPYENIFAIQRAQIEALTKATQTFMEGLSAISREAVDFSDQRVRFLTESSRDVPNAADWSDVWTFQVNYADRATQAYLEEATKLFDLGMKVSQESWQPLQESMAVAMGGMFRKPD